ncbi:MAG: NAD(P)/FAD-dependent oxidoreductase [Thermodesulfobacteriota bacterium]
MKYVIIGGSAAAIRAIEAIRSVDQRSPIELFSDEDTPLFSRVLLPYYVAEELPKKLLNFRPLTFFQDHDVSSHLGVRVTEIDPDSRTITTDEGKSYDYDRLLLATGGKPIIPPIPGVDKKGIFPLKTMNDAEKIYSAEGKKAVVIGAGSIGVESCISLKRKGMEVTLVEQLGRVLPTVFDDQAAGIIRKRIEDLGINVRTGEKAVRFHGNGAVTSMSTEQRDIDCDLVILSIGVTPNVELARSGGLDIGDLGGIKVNERMRTSAAGIFAAGDVTETDDLALDKKSINAIWPCAVEQGYIAGLNMAGRKVRYPGSLRMNSIGNFIGQPAISIGMVNAPVETGGAEAGETYQEVFRSSKDTYRKLILKGERIVGAILVGDTQKAGIIQVLIKKQVEAGEFVPLLLSHRLNFMELLPLIRRHGDKFKETEFKELMDTGL